MSGDAVEGALRQLGDEHRALIELSVVRGVSDEEIAGYLGIDPEVVRERRDAALDAVAAGSGNGSSEGRQQVIDHLRDGAGAVEPTAVPPEAEPPTTPQPEPAGSRRRGVLGPALVGGALIAVAVALVFAFRQSDDAAQKPADRPADNSGASSGAAGGRSAKLEPLAGGPAGGTAVLQRRGDGATLKLSARGLPNPPTGGYVVWLYDSVTDARSLTGSLKGRFRVNTPLPAGYRRYRFIDVSREPADGNRNHSGQSVLRVPVSSLRRPG